jgi:hypothetical protein
MINKLFRCQAYDLPNLLAFEFTADHYISTRILAAPKHTRQVQEVFWFYEEHLASNDIDQVIFGYILELVHVIAIL